MYLIIILILYTILLYTIYSLRIFTVFQCCKEIIKTSEEDDVFATSLINVGTHRQSKCQPLYVGIHIIIIIMLYERVLYVCCAISDVCTWKLQASMTFSIDTCYEGRQLVKAAVYISGLLCPSQCMWVPIYLYIT